MTDRTDIATQTTPAGGPGRARLARLGRRSVEIIAGGQHTSGAYVACPNFAPYRYCWFRDGAFIADAMSRAGHVDSAEAFFGWCRRVITDRADQIHQLVERRRTGDTIGHDEHLHTRYTLDGREGDEDWWNFQLDGYGTWMWALHAHLDRHDRPAAPYADAVELTTDYLFTFWDQPSYDWWEEHRDHRHSSTLAAIHAGLTATTQLSTTPHRQAERAADTTERIRQLVDEHGTHDGRLTKWLGATTVDASLLACATPFRVYEPDHPVMAATNRQIDRRLTGPGGGVYRYADDTYYGGGRWILLTALHGWHLLETGDVDAAYAKLDWCARQADDDGRLPEQVDGHLLAPERRQGWLERWGPVATPLLWSHAMYLTLALQLGAVTPDELASEASRTR